MTLTALLTFLFFGPAGWRMQEPPEQPYVDPERAACKVWWSATEHRCRDADIEDLGEIDVRPNPSEWPANDFDRAPSSPGPYLMP